MRVRDYTPRNILAFGSLRLNLEGWLLMLQKDRSAPRDIQKTNCAVHFSSMSTQYPSTGVQLHCLRVSAISYIVVSPWPPRELPW